MLEGKMQVVEGGRDGDKNHKEGEMREGEKRRERERKRKEKAEE
jgi:hypothetical protein